MEAIMDNDAGIYLCDLTYTQQTVASDVMPAAIGGIAAYLKEEIPSIDVRLFKYPERLISELEAVRSGGKAIPRLVGFSNYVWNCNLSLGFAEAIKRAFPSVIIVFGGPNLAYDATEQEQFLRDHPVIDFHIVKEGETAFCNLVRKLMSHDWQASAVSEAEVSNLVFIDQHGQFRASPKIERVPLEMLPSPYTAGFMDEFFDGKLYPIIQTNRGCPFECTFCTEGMHHWTKIKRKKRERIDDEIMYIAQKMDSLGDRARRDLHIADSNFGMYPDDLDTAGTLAAARERFDYPQYVNVATGKNKKERVLEVARILKGAMKLMGSVQSLDSQVLVNIKRKNISLEQLIELALDAKEIGANSWSEIILALPGDTLQAHFESLRMLVEAGFNTMSMYQLIILPGTEMGSLDSRAKYGMKTKYRLVPRCYGYYDVLGQQVSVGELEEIVVENNTLSYADYLAARKMNLIVNVFYNDGVFVELLKYFKLRNLSAWEWLSIIYEKYADFAEFGEFTSKFVGETEGELWHSAEDLMTFCKSPANIQKVIDGEIGGNLMYNYKGLSMTRYLDSVAEVAKLASDELLRRHKLEHDIQFVMDIVDFNYLRMRDIFVENPETYTRSFGYDILRFAADAKPSDIDDYRFAEPQGFRFVFTEEQKHILSGFVKLFGTNTTGVSRTLSRVYIRKLLREAHELAGDRVFEATPEKGFVIGETSMTGLNEFH
jgi:radical SAM superfamily enzyme YgiQ (UPF0313 family)